MNALSKASIAEVLCSELNLSKVNAKKMIDQFFEEIRLLLEHGQQVKLSGFGNFNLRDKSERPGRNPKTGIAAPISARRVVTFKSGLKLKGSIRKNM